MAKYIAKRLLQIIPTFLLLTLLVYTILSLSPADPAMMRLGNGATQEAIDEIHHELGLDQPLLVRYGKYMWELFTKGEMGKSWVMQTSVKKNFIQRLPNTLLLTAMALLLTSVVGIVAGVFAAVNQNSAGDRITMILAMLIISLPNFFLSLICQIFICLKLKWLPVAGAGSFRHFILPSIMLAASRVAGQIRLTRSSMLDVLGQDYIRTAYAKGCSKLRVVSYHALRNGLLPVITGIGNQVGGLVAGAVTVETIFAIPGVGSMLVNAVRSNDIPEVMGPIIFISLLVCVVNLLVDFLYAVVDPRVKLQYR
ncbi:MAG: ABC transporter permease [Clostridiales bacterium]|nr:ABC transporter permease [Clostridiales bacterium]